VCSCAHKYIEVFFFSDKPTTVDDPKQNSAKVIAVLGARVTLRCTVSGSPYPNVTWYKPNGQPVRYNVMSFPGMSEVSFTIENAQDYGKYKYRMENIIGYFERNITVLPYGEFFCFSQVLGPKIDLLIIFYILSVTERGWIDS